MSTITLPFPGEDTVIDPVLGRLRALGGNFILPFQLEESGLRGRLIRMDAAVNDILQRHNYPDLASNLLGQALALTAALSATVKFEGKFTLQMQGDGPLRMLVADVDTGGHLRGYVGFNKDRTDELTDGASLARLFGGGHLAFTVERAGGEGRYQGIVALEGETMADSVHHYFRQSEQIPTGLRLACQRGEDGQWRASALLVQRVPDSGGEAVSGDALNAFRPPPETWEEDEGYMRAMALLATVREGEMLNDEDAPERLLFSLFHEDGVRVFEPEAITGDCACAPRKFHDLLASLPRTELEDCKVDGVIDIVCEFCGKTEQFDDAALDALFDGQPG